MVHAMSWENFLQVLSQLLKGTQISLSVFALTLLFALPLGLFLALGRLLKNKFARFPFTVYILIMRGTPLLLQIIIIYFGPYYLFGLNYDRFAGVVIAFVLNYAAYFAEIYRGGILSVPQGQYEAGFVLGLSKPKIFFKIILPQVIKRILPPTSNEVITLVKDTSLVQIIGLLDLFGKAKSISSKSGDITSLLLAGVFYLIMNFFVTRFFTHFERKLDYYR